MIESIRSQNNIKASKPRKNAQKRAPKPTAAPVTAQPLENGQRAEKLANLSPTDQQLMSEVTARLERGEDPATVKAWFEAQHVEPEPVAQPIVDPDDLSMMDKLTCFVLSEILTSGMLPSSILNIDGQSGSGLVYLWQDISTGLRKGFEAVDPVALAHFALADSSEAAS